MPRQRNFEELPNVSKKWKIKFDVSHPDIQDTDIAVIFTRQVHEITNEELEELKNDLKDLGKLRLYKTAKRYLESEE